MRTTSYSVEEQALIYKRLFELLSLNTQEYDNILNFIHQEVLTEIPSQNHFIDIGAGRGNIAKPLAAHFNKTTIIEPNPHFYDDVMAWANSTEHNIQGFNTTWEDAPLNGSTRADLAVISHVLYYVPLEDHQAFIEKALGCLRANGRLIIMLNGMASDIWRLARLTYTPEAFDGLPYAERVAEQLIEWDYPVGFAPFYSDIWTETRDEMRHMIDFLLLGRADFSDPKNIQIREDYIDKYLVRDDGYSIASSGGIIVVGKK